MMDDCDDDFYEQVGSISKKWSGVLKEVLTKADRFSIDFPPDIGWFFYVWFFVKNALLLDIGMKATLLGMTFLIDYLHFEADPTDDIDEDTP